MPRVLVCLVWSFGRVIPAGGVGKIEAEWSCCEYFRWPRKFCVCAFINFGLIFFQVPSARTCPGAAAGGGGGGGSGGRQARRRAGAPCAARYLRRYAEPGASDAPRLPTSGRPARDKKNDNNK